MENKKNTTDKVKIVSDRTWVLKTQRQTEKEWREFQKIKDDPEAVAKALAETNAEIERLEEKIRKYEIEHLGGESLVDRRPI